MFVFSIFKKFYHGQNRYRHFPFKDIQICDFKFKNFDKNTIHRGLF